MIVVLLLFVLPSRIDCRKEVPPRLITWQYVLKKMHWSLIFLLGGGFAIAEAMKSSGLGDLIANELYAVTHYPRLVIMILACIIASVVTQFTSNAAICNILLPVVSSLATVRNTYCNIPIVY